MPAVLSLDLRERVVRELETPSKTPLEVAAQFRIGVATVKRLVRRQRETGGLAPKVNRGPISLREIREDGRELIRTWLTVDADLTNWELADRCPMETGVRVSPATISRTLARMGFDETGSHIALTRPTGGGASWPEAMELITSSDALGWFQHGGVAVRAS